MTVIIMQQDPDKPEWTRQIDLFTVPLTTHLPQIGDFYTGEGTGDYAYKVREREFSYNGTRHNDDNEVWDLSCTWVKLTIDGHYDGTETEER